MSPREQDRFDTYEFCKYNHPLAAQQLTAEVIYKFIIEDSKVSGLLNLLSKIYFHSTIKR